MGTRIESNTMRFHIQKYRTYSEHFASETSMPMIITILCNRMSRIEKFLAFPGLGFSRDQEMPRTF